MIALVFKHERAAAPGNKQVIVLVLVSHGKTEEIFFLGGKGGRKEGGFLGGAFVKIGRKKRNKEAGRHEKEHVH